MAPDAITFLDFAWKQAGTVHACNLTLGLNYTKQLMSTIMIHR
jgi:hypothetical protein